MGSFDAWLAGLTFVSALGSGLIAGVFYAFSTFVMKALGRLPPHEGAAAMQSINAAVINPMFLGAFLGTAATCAALVAGGVIRWERPESAYYLAGGLLYVVGTFLVTVVRNVPLNNRLAAVAPTDAGAPQEWERYLSRWTTWNHVRTVSALGATALLVLALRR